MGSTSNQTANRQVDCRYEQVGPDTVSTAPPGKTKPGGHYRTGQGKQSSYGAAG
jgi:hypothetical protein